MADFRRLAARRDRWHLVGTVLCVAAVVALVFWLLPLPPKAPEVTPPAAATTQRAGA